MKKIFLALLLVFKLSLVSAQYQETFVSPKVDERTELLSIVFRLAGAQEYVNNDIQLYTYDIDEYFEPYTEHEAISFVKEMRAQQNVQVVAYDAVMSFAINIEIVNDSIYFRKDLQESSLDSRWGKQQKEDFLRLLNNFYKKTNFHYFFADHKELYTTAEDRFKEILKAVNFDWYKEFYGQLPDGKFVTIISLCNGGGSYGPKIAYLNGKEDVYSIIGSWKTDSLGYPIYQPETSFTIIHEYNHSFCNPLIDAYYSQMEAKAEEFYSLVSQKMQRQAYGNSKTMLYEMLGRACVIKYMEKQNPAWATYMLSGEQANGFLWIDKLVKLLDDYTSNRDKYPTLKDFMPEIVKLQNSLSPKKIEKQIQKNMPVIVSTNIKKNDQKVDPNLTEIVVKFDRPMHTGANGSSYGKLGKDYMPKVTSAEWNMDTKKEWILKVALEPNTQYSISFPGQFFRSSEFVPAKDIYYLDFKTKNQ